MPTLDLPSFLPFRLNRLAAEISDRLSAIYAERFDLDIPAWRVLATLDDGEEWTAQEIVASTRTHKSTISRAVADLEKRKLVSRVQHEADGRAMTLQLTSRGRQLMDRLIPLAKSFEAELLSTLTSVDRRNLTDGIASLERSLGLSGDKT
ncbi:MAG TPA: MarR family winged helix-turn-helix transcriptional regulator [Rhizobiaceae bacterium]|nr:MarR family winged helix-turn-helix transcriptional regulator [Rhizobiaceae bacterium]